MKSILRSIFSFALVVASATAQSPNAGNSNNATNGKTADGDWATLINLTSPGQTNTSQSKKTASQISGEAQQKTQQARQAALSAKDFYTGYPTHINAPKAKKLEALMALQGVADDDKSYELSAKQIANAYRNNNNNRAGDRFEVAVLSERVEARARLGGKVFGVYVQPAGRAVRLGQPHQTLLRWRS